MRNIYVFFFVLLCFLTDSANAGTIQYTTYYHNDNLGSPIAITDSQGELISRVNYRAYGASEESKISNINFTGHIKDPSSALIYAGARYYDPVIGRFLSVDPVKPNISSPETFNRYAYANNNPYRYADPTGKWAEDFIIGMPSLVLGTNSLKDNFNEGNYLAATIDAGGVIFDGIAILIPGIPGGAGLTIKATRELEQAAEKAARLAENYKSGKSAEKAVRDAYDIGPNGRFNINGRDRISDGYTDVAIVEIKNVKYQGFTSQLRDYLQYAQDTERQLILFTRGGDNPTKLSGPLEEAIRNGLIIHRTIPEIPGK
ncbi:hypothetical protein HKW97_17760 [Pseudomonas luteola]|uniref:RHS repeat-associated core domain-containing protein n=1 Tax=Pseudomonas luteola TaxID=47886 RepID=UPI00388E287E